MVESPAVRWWRLPLLLVVVFVALQCLTGPRWTGVTGDSYEYARISLGILGKPKAQAEREAWNWWCASRAAEAARTARVDPISFRHASPESTEYQRCARKYATHAANYPTQPRYQAIFNARPGYPALAAPAIAVFGVGGGLWVTDIAITAGAALLVAALLGAVGVGTLGVLIGQAGYLLGTLGMWSMRPLAEGAVNAAVIAVLLGAWWLLNRRRLLGCGVLAVGLVMAGAVKHSSGLLLAVCMAAVAGVCWLLVPAARHRGTLLLGGFSAVAAAVVLVMGRLLGLPGAVDTLQDTFTRHYHRPDVANPWQLFLQLNGHYWWEWLQQQAARPLLPVLGAVAIWALWRHSRLLGLLALGAAVVGVLTIAAHPLGTEGDRLGALMWLPVVLGLPLAVTGTLSSASQDPLRPDADDAGSGASSRTNARRDAEMGSVNLTADPTIMGETSSD